MIASSEQLQDAGPLLKLSVFFFNAGSAARQWLFIERGNTQKLYKKSGSPARQWGKVYEKCG